MSTGNFITQENFDSYCYFSEAEDENESYWDYEDAISNAKYDIEKYNLKYFNIELKSGYYEGIQTLIESKNDWYDADDLAAEKYDNNDSKYLWDECRSITRRKIKSEIRKINKEILPKLRDYGFKKFGQVGRFSNGECVYTYL